MGTFVKMWLLALLAGLLITVSATGEEIPEDSDSDEDLYTSISVEDYENTQAKHKNLVDSMNYFTSELLINLLENKILSGNVLFSPFSCHLALGMVAIGAKGKTKKEIESGLGYSNDDQTLNAEYKNVLKKLNSDKNVTLESANKAYLSKQPSSSYSDAIKETFNAKPSLVTFKKENEDEIRREINEYVEKKTHGKIKNFLSKGIIKKNTAFILINALYFKGTWEHTFDKRLTKEAKFYPTSEGEEIKVPMMRMRRPIKTFYTKMDPFNAKVIHLPYAGNRVSMILILPKERHRLDTVVKNIKDLGLQKLLELLEEEKKGRKRSVRVYLPKFSSKKTLRLNGPLKELGMKRMFSRDAEFEMLADKKEKVKVSQLLQKIHLSVYEEGSEAASATAVIGSHFMSAAIIEEFKCDEPFLLLLLDELTKMILFAGKIKDPNLPD